MTLRTYIERDGQRISRAHPELARVAKAIRVSPYTLYMVALGHKTLGVRKAAALVELTGGAVEGRSVCVGYPGQAA